MKHFILSVALVLISIACSAEDRPVTFEQLPQAAKELISKYYPGEKITYAVVDDDFIRPDYEVVLASGVKMQFEHSGSLEKIKSKVGLPEGLIPVQIRGYVSAQYPDIVIVEYEIGRRTYEIKLSNRLELKFSSSFQLIGLDD